MGPNSRPFSIYQTAKTSQKPIIMSLRFFGLLKMRTNTMRNSAHHLLKTDLVILQFYQNNERAWYYFLVLTIYPITNWEWSS